MKIFFDYATKLMVIIAVCMISNLIEIKDLSAGDHFKPAVIYDMGGKFDKSFNEGVWNGVQKFTKEKHQEGKWKRKKS